MHSNDGDDLVGFSVNHTDVVGFGVGYVDFILVGVGGESRRAPAYGYGCENAQGTQVNYRHRITAAVRDVSVFVVVGTGLRRFGTAAEKEECRRQKKQDGAWQFILQPL